MAVITGTAARLLAVKLVAMCSGSSGGAWKIIFSKLAAVATTCSGAGKILFSKLVAVVTTCSGAWKILFSKLVAVATTCSGAWKIIFSKLAAVVTTCGGTHGGPNKFKVGGSSCDLKWFLLIWNEFSVNRQR